MNGTLFFFFSLLVGSVVAQTSTGHTGDHQIRQERFVQINGLEQWVTIRGDSTKPAVLFIHGGPGSPLSPYAEAIYGQWEKDFILIQWDQRGTGRTFGYKAPDELTPEYLRSHPLTLEDMTQDGIELSQYLLKRLGKQKLILFGSSWGSLLSVRMVQKKPELFYAYIGHSQLINPIAGALSAYNKVDQLARRSHDEEALAILRSIGKPPYDTATNAGRFMRLVKKYQQKGAAPAPPTWFVLAAAYDNKKDHQDRENGDDYSFVHYNGDSRLGIKSISASIDLFNEALDFKLPVYFIQGAQDIQTPAAMMKRYFKKIKAPDKKLFLLSKSEHGFNQDVLDAHLTIMKTIIVPHLHRL